MKKLREWSRNFKVGVRLLASFGFIIILVVILNATAIFNINKLSANTVELYNKPFTIVDKISDSRRCLAIVEKDLFRGLMSNTNDDMENYFASVEKENQSIFDYIEYLKTTQADNKQMSIYINKYELEMTDLRVSSNKIIELAKGKKLKEAKNIFENEYVPAISNTAGTATAVYNIAGTDANSFVENSKRARVNTIILMDLVFAVTLFFALFLAIFSTKNIVVPMKKMVYALDEVSKGNLNIQIHDVGNDELTTLSNSTSKLINNLKNIIMDITYTLEEMSNNNLNVHSTREYEGDFIPIEKSINKILSSFNKTLIQINESSEQVSESSEHMSSSAQSLSEGSTEQSDSIENLSDIINEIAENIKNNAENATKSCLLTSEAGQKLAKGNENIQEMLVSMNEITQAAQKINDIVDTINSIANQTNVLALNATIESARAGIAGRGFAVVADEVRKLANESAIAANETTLLVKSAIKAIEKGTNTVNKTASTITEVMTAAQKVTNIVEEISIASNQQSLSVEQVALTVEQIATVVQVNSEISEESATSAEELMQHAKFLKKLVKKFQLKH